MADIFQEVNEEVRKDRALEYWNKYGGYVIGACIALVVATGAKVAWTDYQQNQRVEESRQFMAAVRLQTEQKNAAAINAFGALAGEASTGYATLARLREAAERARSGDKAAAIAAYDKVVEDGDGGQALSDLARLSAVLLMIDDGANAAIEKRLAPLLEGNSAWRPLALEVRAIVAFRDGDLASAAKLFKTLGQMAGAPAGVRQRAAQMLAVLGQDS